MLGKRIRELREESNLFQKHLAQKIGVSQPLIGYWETETRLPSLADVIKIEEVFNINDNELVFLSLRDRLGEFYEEFINNINVAEKVRYSQEIQDMINAMVNVDHPTQKKILAGAKAFVPEAFGKYPKGYKFPVGFTNPADARQYYYSKVVFSAASDGTEPDDEEIIELANDIFEEEKHERFHSVP